MDYKDAFELMVRLEGWESLVYEDSMGLKTVGVGFNMDAKGARNTWNKLNIPEDFDNVYNGHQEISKESAMKLFSRVWNRSVIQATRRAKVLGVDYNSLPEYHQFILAGIAYNTGSVSGWTKVFLATDPKKVIYEARRKPKELMDSRVAKIAYYYGIIGSVEEAKEIGLIYTKYIV